MKKKIIFSLFALFLLAGTFLAGWAASYIYFNPQSQVASANSEPVNLDSMKIYNLVNDYRASQGLNKLVFDPRICDFSIKRLSQIHSNFSHDNFKPDIWSDISANNVGENLAQGQLTEQSLLNEWINSPTHLDILTRNEYTNTCVVTDIHNNMTYTVQNFSSNF